MGWEINERREGYTIWQGKDAEGRRCWATTIDRDGIGTVPLGANIYYSKALAANKREPSLRSR